MELLACPSCHQTLSAPITLKCGHTFCRGCLSAKRQKVCSICRLKYKVTPNINICLHHIVELATQLQTKYSFDPDAMVFEPAGSKSTAGDPYFDVQEVLPPHASHAGGADSPRTFDTLLANTAQNNEQGSGTQPRLSIANEIISNYRRTSRISQHIEDENDESLFSTSSPAPSLVAPVPVSHKSKNRQANPKRTEEVIKRNNPIELLSIPALKPARKQDCRSAGSWPSRQPDARPRKKVVWAPDVVDNSPQFGYRIPKDVGICSNNDSGSGMLRSEPLPFSSPPEECSPPQCLVQTHGADDLRPGDAVRVRAECSEFGREWSGQIGTVRAVHGEAVTISLHTAIWTCSTSDVERVESAGGDRAPAGRFKGLLGSLRPGCNVGRPAGST